MLLHHAYSVCYMLTCVECINGIRACWLLVALLKPVSMYLNLVLLLPPALPVIVYHRLQEELPSLIR